jgi:hypothetical protein
MVADLQAHGEFRGLTDRDWDALLRAIDHKLCTPFLGAGSCAGVLPLGREIAQALAEEYGYPFPDTTNLMRVAQYVAVEGGGGPDEPRLRIKEALQHATPPDFSDPDEPHRVLSDLGLPLYITTNYDDFMLQALLRGRSPRPAQWDVCRWYLARRGKRIKAHVEPTPEQPLVFHLHGCLKTVESMVVSEDDYLDFLMFISEDRKLIPPRIEEAFASTSLLFMGYSLDDMSFKVLFRKLAIYMQVGQAARHVSVQLGPSDSEVDGNQVDRLRQQRKYLEEQFNLKGVKVYWGTCAQFAAELRWRWEAFHAH